MQTIVHGSPTRARPSLSRPWLPFFFVFFVVEPLLRSRRPASHGQNKNTRSDGQRRAARKPKDERRVRFETCTGSCASQSGRFFPPFFSPMTETQLCRTLCSASDGVPVCRGWVCGPDKSVQMNEGDPKVRPKLHAGSLSLSFVCMPTTTYTHTHTPPSLFLSLILSPSLKSVPCFPLSCLADLSACAAVPLLLCFLCMGRPLAL